MDIDLNAVPDEQVQVQEPNQLMQEKEHDVVILTGPIVQFAYEGIHLPMTTWKSYP
jgi:hypothetical protein